MYNIKILKLYYMIYEDLAVFVNQLKYEVGIAKQSIKG